MNEDCLKLTAYFGERDRAHDRWLADALIDIYARHELATSLVMRGIEGFGVKQHLHIKAFFGTTPNAFKAQLWAAVIAYVLVVRLKHRHGLSRETNEILQVLSVTILEKTPVFELFSRFDSRSDGRQSPNQLALFEL